MELRTIRVRVSCLVPEFVMILAVPEDSDSAGFIDECLDCILDKNIRNDAAWGFVDGIS